MALAALRPSPAARRSCPALSSLDNPRKPPNTLAEPNPPRLLGGVNALTRRPTPDARRPKHAPPGMTGTGAQSRFAKRKLYR
ncbi:MAG: hypothetical protein M1838_001315 [Thelocarpon superellum]|nr:MAG: hypothetical protein M1838_001315 [Thelocarpon superellum]